MTPEFSRPHRLDQIGAGEAQIEVTADPEERTALARRFGLKAVDRLEARFALRRDAAGVIARGHLSGAVTQACVVTDEALPAKIEEDFAIRFLPEPGEGEAADEVELSEDECDTVFYSGGAIDLGEAAAETLALALDPFPRSPNAAAVLKDAGVLSEEEAKRLAEESGPFGGLAALRDKLEKKD
ncbi:MAG TPA: YceD family protein [Sphingomonas sp.]|nr:YceD family protein [Sphingomonas sp.]